jgi:hypothetical protein
MRHFHGLLGMLLLIHIFWRHFRQSWFDRVRLGNAHGLVCLLEVKRRVLGCLGRHEIVNRPLLEHLLVFYVKLLLRIRV